MLDVSKQAVELHARLRGKISTTLKHQIETREDLSLMYTPGVAAASLEAASGEGRAYELTWKGNAVAVVSDGSRVLGLGDIGPLGALPVMEGKCALYKRFAGIDAIPVCTNTKTADELIAVVKAISPSFGGINLEDIDSPKCFQVDATLTRELDIPVFHDDQHGTAVVTLAAVYNSLKLTGRKLAETRFVVNGCGAAGIAITKLLLAAGARHVVVLDSKGVVALDRETLSPEKEEVAKLTKTANTGTLADAVKGADVFIGVSKAGVLTEGHVKSMASGPVILAMANPEPEILPDKAKKAGAAIVGTGSSLYDNQVNNVSSFPGLMRGLLDCRARRINVEAKLAAAKAIAGMVEPQPDLILPKPWDDSVAPKVAAAVVETAWKTGIARIPIKNLNEYAESVRKRVASSRQAKV